MPAFHRSIRAMVLASAFSLSIPPAFGQANPESAKIPQPHLAKARAIAFEENSWKFPALITCYPDEGQSAEHVIKHPGPGKAADNFYFLGTGIVAAWAVNTSDGIILIDALDNQREVDEFVIGGLKQLGQDPARIKTIIVSHGHGDHYGGARYLQGKYHAKLYMTALDYDLAEKPLTQARDWGPPPRRDQVVKDGDTVTLGDVSIKLFVTAGHTPASLSMLIPVKDKGQNRTLLYLGGITNKGLKRDMHDAYDKWTDRLLKDAGTADGVIGNHSSYDETATKLDKLRILPNKPNPFFTGAANTVRYLRVLKECNLNNWEIEKALRPQN